MELNLKFKTKLGYCHILEDKLVFSPNEMLKDKDLVNNNNRIWLMRTLYGIGLLASLYAIYYDIITDEYPSFYTSLMFVFLCLGFVQSFRVNGQSVIERKQISAVDFVQAKKKVTRGFFKVHFKDEKNSDQTRLILLPGSLSGGEQATEEALKVMSEARIEITKSN